MNRLFDNGSLGSYFINSLILQLNGEYDLECMEKYKEDKSFMLTLAHECIHFIQNISTSYGIAGLTMYFAEIREELYLKANPDFLDYNSNISTYVERINIAMGECAPATYEYHSNLRFIDIKYDENLFGEEYEDYLPPIVKLCITEKNGNIHNEEFSFGGRSVMESMCHSFELYTSCNHTMVGKSFQYDCCQLIWSHYLPLYFDRFDLIFLACDCALMTLNPGMAFWIVVSQYLINYKDLTYDIIIWCFECYGSTNQLMNTWVSECFSHINKLFPKHNTCCKGINLYLSQIIENFCKIRNERLNIWMDLLNSSSNDAIFRFFNILQNNSALPLFVNENYEIFSGENNFFKNRNAFDLTIMLGYYAFYEISKGKQSKCPLYSYCEKQGIVDELQCNGTELLEMVNREKLCLIAAIYHMWQLK